jgi:Putative auto-transporter adhesin, head GIN domain
MSLIGKGPVVALLVLAACAAHAEKRTEERAVTPFSKLRVENGIDVSLIQGDRPSLTIEADDSVLKDIVTEVHGGELRISRARNSGFGFSGRDARVQLTFVQLSDIEASGGSDIDSRGDIKLDDLSVSASGGSDVDLAVDAKNLELSLSGGSDLKLRGSASSLTVTASGGSDIGAGELMADRVTLRVSGGSDAHVNAKEAIELDASGGSDVTVSGNPERRTVNNDRSSDVLWR